MATITLELDDAHAALLRQLAEERESDIAAVVVELLDALDMDYANAPFTPEQEAQIRAGIADADAGRLVDHTALFDRLDEKFGP